MREGKFRHVWRVVGDVSNVSIFDVDTHAELHDILQNLPLFPYMDVKVTPLAEHPPRPAGDVRLRVLTAAVN